VADRSCLAYIQSCFDRGRPDEYDQNLSVKRGSSRQHLLLCHGATQYHHRRGWWGFCSKEIPPEQGIPGSRCECLDAIWAGTDRYACIWTRLGRGGHDAPESS
jgi:hypothetical protein